VNLYYMDYINQLVKTGQLNDVGDAIMVNIPKSYRAGIEVTGGMKFFNFIDWQINATLSRNKIKDYTEYVDNWDLGGQNENKIGESNLSFSPEIVAGSQLAFMPFKNFEIALISKYVGDQYIDNSSAKDRMLNAYFVNNLRINYSIKTKFIKSIDLQFMVNNIFNQEYETDGWVYRYFYENAYYNMDGYFPQAGINLMGGVVLNF
jgi:iron complex outermembrane recepter protein